MLASRWRCVLLFIGLALGAGLGVAAQEPLPDLRVALIGLDPDVAMSGEPVTATVIVERTGGALPQDAEVDITWRRRDREEPCGTSVGIYPAAEPSLALQFVVPIPTADLAPGTYEVIATVDPRGAIAEASEANNRLAAGLEILPPRPELHPTRVEIAPASPLLWGETATVTAGVVNTGRASAGPFHVSFAAFPVYCVNEATGERWVIAPSEAANARGLYSWQFVPDDGSRSPQRTGLPTLSRSLPAGAWVVFAETQAAGLAQAAATELYAAFATGLPLRQLLTTSGARDGAVAGSSMALLSAADVARLEACTTTYALRVEVRDAYDIADEDPKNNAIDLALCVRASTLELADLVPIEAAFDRAMPLNWDDDVDIEVVVANRGGGPAPATGAAAITVGFSYRALGAVAWKSLGTRTIARLGIDEDTNTDSVQATLDASPSQLNLAPGSYELRIAVDEANAIPEQDETNNEIILGFSVQGTELHPVGIEISSSTIRQGDSVDIVATIENTGERSLEGFSVGFYVGEQRFATFAYRATTTADPGLEEEDRTRVKGTLSTQDLVPGAYSLRVVADPDNRIPELDETNNEIRTTITILPPAERLAELYVSGVVLNPASPVPSGQPIAVAATVRNGGTIDAGRFSVAFVVLRDDGTTWSAGQVDCSAASPVAAGAQACACRPASSLGRGAATTLTHTLWTTDWPEGHYVLHVWVDPPTSSSPDGEVREQDETNNEMVVAFSIGRAIPDGIASGVNLVVDAVGVQPAEAALGATQAVLVATITNRGTEPAGPFAVDVMWLRQIGSPVLLARISLEGLAALQSTTIRQDVSLGSIGWTCGDHTFSVVADTQGALAETNETDNAASASFRVVCGPTSGTGPDLTAELLVPAARSGTLSAGCPATAKVTVTNRGGLAAGPFRVEFRLGGNAVAVQDVAGLGAQASASVYFDLPTSTPSTLALAAIVDSEGRVAEGNEANNTASLSVIVATPAASTATRVGGPYRGAVGTLLHDAATGTVVAASDDGVLHAFARGAPPTPLYDATLGDSAKVTGLALDRGSATRTLYAVTASGQLHRIAFLTGAPMGSAVRVGDQATSLTLDLAGTAYIGTESGIAVVKRSSASPSSLDLGARVIALALDASGTVLYALTTTTLYAISTANLTVVCSAGSFGADATALALGPAGIYVGTSTGRVIAFAPCASYGSLGTAMLRSWNVDLSSAGGLVTSLAVYPETTADPLYVALCEGTTGRIVALSLAGRMLWTTGATAIGCVAGPLTVDRTRGRVSFAEVGGTVRVLDDRGEALVVEGALAGQGKTARSNVVTDSWVGERDGISRLQELFYVGTSDGSVYVVETARGGCP